MAGQRYSPLAQITPQNVLELEVAWEYHAGDIHVDLPGTALESTPLIVNDTIYLYTPPQSEIIALDPVTGKERWRFSPNLVGLTDKLSTYATCLGWEISKELPPNKEQARSLVEASMAGVTTGASGVAQNVAADTAAQAGAPNPVIVDDALTKIWRLARNRGRCGGQQMANPHRLPT